MLEEEITTRLSSLAYGSPAVSVPCFYLHGKEAPAPADYPHVVWSLVSDPAEEYIDGALAISEARFSFDCMALTARVTKLVAAALVSLFQAHHGTEILSASLENTFDLFDVDTGAYSRIVDFTIQH